MKFPALRFTLASALMGLVTLSWAAVEPSKAEVEGRALVAELLAQMPMENSEWRGVFRIRNRDRRATAVPVTGRIIVENDGWKIVYSTGATEKGGAETLTVVHSTNGINQYLYAGAADSLGGLPKQLTGDEAGIALAGSDFWLSDLGLDFLHWPVQRLLKKELGPSTMLLM